MKGLNKNFIFAVTSAALGSGFQHGYHTGVVNTPENVIRHWIGSSYYNRTQQFLKRDQMNYIWATTTSLMNLGGCVGGVLSGLVATKWGPKLGLIFNNIIVAIACVLMFMSEYIKSFELLMVGRFLVGINCGFNAGLCPMYLSEISPVSLRGAVGSIYQLVITISICLALALGIEEVLGSPKLWNTLFLIPLALAVFQVASLPFCSDSPSYLISSEKGSEEKALKSLQWLRGTDDVASEMAVIKSENDAVKSLPKITLKDMVKTKSLRTPLIISVVIMVAQQFSGINAIMFYGNTIFEDAGVQPDDIKYATIFGIGVVNVLMTVVSVVLVEIAGRKTLLLVAFAGLAVDTALFGTLMIIKESFEETKQYVAYASILLIIIYVILFAAGAGSIPWFLVTEIFTQAARPTAVSLAVPTNWLANFIVTWLFPVLKTSMEGSVFYIFAGLNTLFAVFIAFMVPETKNKTIEEITALF